MPQQTPSHQPSSGSNVRPRPDRAAVANGHAMGEPPRSGAPRSGAPLSEASIDELMDAVFEDVDYMLEQGVSILPDVASDPSSSEALRSNGTGQSFASVEPSMADPAGAIATTGSGDAAADMAHFDDALAVDGSEPNWMESDGQGDEPDPGENAEQWRQAVALAFPILGACAALGVALAAGIVLHGNPFGVNSATGGDTPAGPTNPSSNGEFADYMERALEAIASTDLDDPTLGGVTAGNGTETASFPEAPALDPNRRAALPQRPYVDTYSNTAAASLPTGAPQSLPPAPLTPVPLAPAPIAPAPLATPTPSVAAIPAPAPTPAPAPQSDLNHDHVLVGVLQFGDRSSAMFDHAEGTHRVRVGEQIGTTGWTLVSVSQNEVVIGRNGDQRSLYIGQSF